jgi:ABC-type polysaccharide/polyol phosphate transport system ATPase subunit
MGKHFFEHRSLKKIEMKQRTKIAPSGHGFAPVVRDISFTLKGGQKLGICGRTGR